MHYLDDLITELKSHLAEYLDSQSVEKSGNRYTCINPNHIDSHPSSTIFTNEKGEKHLKCWSCDIGSLDIFAACHILEGKPVSGTGFFTETIPYLASKFGIEVPKYNISEKERETILIRRMYKSAEDFILSYSSDSIPENISKELSRRGWTEISKVKNLGIGFVPSYYTFRAHLKSLGYTIKAIEESGLSDPYLFNENRLIFSYRDENGEPVGFIGRNLIFVSEKDPETHSYVNGPKYVFNKSPNVKILNKDKRLYLFDRAKLSTSNVLYIVEGQPDSISFHYHGFDNFASLSGVIMGVSHFELLRRSGIYDVVICLDNDAPGQKAAEALIETVLKHVNDIRVRFVFLPTEDGQKVDPDIIARSGKFEQFFELPKVNPFDFMLNSIISSLDEVDPELICNKVLPAIVNDPSSIRRETMISTLSLSTGISEKALKDEVKRISENKSQKVTSLKKDILNKLSNKISSVDNPNEAEALLGETIEQFRLIDKESSSEILSTKNLLSKFLEIKRYEEGESLVNYLKVDPNLEIFMSSIEGDLSQKLILCPAPPNTGGWNFIIIPFTLGCASSKFNYYKIP